MTDTSLHFFLERFNQSLAALLADSTKHPGLRNDWRYTVAEAGLLDHGLAEFVVELPPHSVLAIQRLINSVTEGGGSLRLEPGAENGVALIGHHVPVAHPDIRLIVCTCDANFKNCRWFWQKK